MKPKTAIGHGIDLSDWSCFFFHMPSLRNRERKPVYPKDSLTLVLRLTDRRSALKVTFVSVIYIAHSIETIVNNRTPTYRNYFSIRDTEKKVATEAAAAATVTVAEKREKKIEEETLRYIEKRKHRSKIPEEEEEEKYEITIKR